MFRKKVTPKKNSTPFSLPPSGKIGGKSAYSESIDEEGVESLTSPLSTPTRSSQSQPRVGNELPSAYRPQSNESQARVDTCNELPSAYRPQSNGLSSAYRPQSNGLSSSCHPQSNGLSSSCHPQSLSSYLPQGEELRQSLLYLASLIPRNELTWTCFFVDTPPQTGNLTKVEGQEMTIRATLPRQAESFILLPFGLEPVSCDFGGKVDFLVQAEQGQGYVDAIHTCERGIHKLLFPEEVRIDNIKYNLRELLPVLLTH